MAWAHENFLFAELENGTELTVQLDTLPEHEQYMLDTYPTALGVLKGICETNP